MKINETVPPTQYQDSFYDKKTSRESGTSRLKMGRDTVEISQNACKEAVYQYTQRLNEILEKQQKAKPKKSSSDDQAKAMRIAAKIMTGKKVTPKEREFLIKYNPKLYENAMKIAMLLPKDKKQKKSNREKDEDKNENLIDDLRQKITDLEQDGND